MTICLIISSPTDEHATAVQKHLSELGVTVYYFYPETLGVNTSMSITILNQTLRVVIDVFDLTGNIVGLDIREINSVWFRRPQAPNLAPLHLSHHALSFTQDEWAYAISSLYSLLNHCLWVSHPDALHLALRKPVQLVIAGSVGFPIPRTLCSNNPTQVRFFVDNAFDLFAVKAIGRGWVVRDEEGHQVVDFVMTNVVTPTELSDADNLRVAPFILQNYLKKSYELRVYVVGSKVLAIKIDNQPSSISAVDWRRYDLANTPYTQYQLPDDIAENCREVTRRLGLQFGAIDLVRTPDGEYVFLERVC